MKERGLSLSPGTLVAGYAVEALLATGGAGTVYRASRGGRHVALKVIPKDAWGEREVDALRRVQHAPVVGLLGYGGWPDTDPRYLVLTLELVEGLSLDDWVRTHGPSSRQLVHQVLLPLIRALVQVHAAGVVHRDIKESNVVIRQGDGSPVLVDFGSARYEGASRLTDRLPPGTREYRSPEMWHFAVDWDGGHYPASASDDWWALGVTLYGLLTRELPFGDRGGPLMKRILEQAPRPVHELNPRVPPALGEVCLRMLRKETGARYPDAQALVLALEEALARADDLWEVPLFAPAPSAAVNQGRRARRAIPGAGLALLLGVLGGLSWKPHSALRMESPSPHPPQQAIKRQELAPAPPPGEVGSSARPPRSSPALVAPAMPHKETPVPKPRPSRVPLTASLLVGSLCMAPGCASAPRLVDGHPPSPIPCPPGAKQTHELHHVGWSGTSVLFDRAANGRGFVRKNKNERLRVTLLRRWGDFPIGAPLQGQVWFGGDRLYGRLTELILPSGERLPICLDLSFNEPGVPMDAKSTPTVAYLNPSAEADLPKSVQP